MRGTITAKDVFRHGATIVRNLGTGLLALLPRGGAVAAPEHLPRGALQTWRHPAGRPPALKRPAAPNPPPPARKPHSRSVVRL